MQLLGLGRNGHIGFHEPGSSAASRTRVFELLPSTCFANAAEFPPGQPVPSRAITVGIGMILEARRIVLLVTGTTKAGALARALEGPVSADGPASFLRRHADVRILADRDAAAGRVATSLRCAHHEGDVIDG